MKSECIEALNGNVLKDTEIIIHFLSSQVLQSKATTIKTGLYICLIQVVPHIRVVVHGLYAYP